MTACRRHSEITENHVTFNPKDATFRAEHVKRGKVAATMHKATKDRSYATEGFTIRAQFMGSSVNVWAVRGDQVVYIGYLNTIKTWDFRKGSEDIRIGYGVRGPKGYDATISGFRHYLSGSGHADFRAVSFEDGTTVQEGNHVWVLATTRGKEIKDAYQGIYRVDVSTGAITMTGAIFGDPGDGSYLNDHAGHLYYDRTVDQWVWTNTAHSNNPGPRANYISKMLYDPREGINHVSVSKIKMPDATTLFEDFHPVRNPNGTWSATASKDFSVSVRLSARAPEGPWKLEAGAGTKETGNLIVTMKGKRYIVAGVGTGFVVRDFDTLRELGRLNVSGAPNADRVWPALFSTTDAEGRERWVMLSFDRTAFSGAYSYGRWYFFVSQPPTR